MLEGYNMRKQVTLGNYVRVKNLFLKAPDMYFSSTSIRDTLNIDYYSVKFIINHLLKEDIIKEVDGRFIKKE
jgi:hypothetical protein